MITVRILPPVRRFGIALFLAFSIFSLWLVLSTRSRWSRPGSGGPEHHLVELGVLSWLEIDARRASAEADWHWSTEVAPDALGANLLLTVVAVGVAARVGRGADDEPTP